MARGWESKAVSDQIEEGKEYVQERPADFERSPERRLQRQQLESLRLSRSRTMAQLEHATIPAHREILAKALRSLEQRIDEISQLLEAAREVQ